VHTLKKSLLLGILYVEILSQPLLATTPILLKMTTPATLQWYAGSFVMHMIAGAVLGAVVGRGLRLGSSRFSSLPDPAGKGNK
jgi:NhaP-type Na+/H+ or K+/H+ antiporter